MIACGDDAIAQVMDNLKIEVGRPNVICMRHAFMRFRGETYWAAVEGTE